MLYAIKIYHSPQKCNAKDGRISALIPDAYAIGNDNFVAKESVFLFLVQMKNFSCQVGRGAIIS